MKDDREDIESGEVWPGPCADPRCQLCAPPSGLELLLGESIERRRGVASSSNSTCVPASTARCEMAKRTRGRSTCARTRLLSPTPATSTRSTFHNPPVSDPMKAPLDGDRLDKIRERLNADRYDQLATLDIAYLLAALPAPPGDTPEKPDLLTRLRELFHDGTPQAFLLDRREDVTGVSGTGPVAEGVRFSDGTVALRWTSDWPTSVVFHDRGVESVEAVHGHDGRTKIVWLGKTRDELFDVIEKLDAAAPPGDTPEKENDEH